MRLLVTRPEADARRQAETLAKLGHEPLLAPLLRIETMQDVRLELEDVVALIATSRNALVALAAHPQREAALRLPLYAVGEATARAASELGFGDVRTGAGTGEELARLIVEQGKPGRAVLHLSGENVAFDLKAALAAQGLKVHRVVLYRSVPVEALPREVVAALEAGRLDGAILMSARTGASFTALIARHGLQGPGSRLICYCLSQAVAQTVEPLGGQAVVAARPREEDVLALLVTEAASLDRSNLPEGRR